MATKNTREIGLDGWPLDLPSEAEQMAEKERQFQQGMQACEARWLAHDLTAVAEAVRALCLHRNGPKWLENAAPVVAARAMAEDEKRARREWRIALTRWEALTELRARRKQLNRPRRVPDGHGGVTLQRDGRGMTMKGARKAVSEILKNDDEAAGTASAIKASFELIEAAGGEGATFEAFLKERHRRSKR
jgi:hypothetical protein